MGLLDASLAVARETVYGTYAAPTRAFEAKEDDHSRTVEYLESTGFRGAMHTTRSDRRRAVTMGAEGTITLDVANKGMGMLFRAMLGAGAAPVQQATTIAWLQTFTTNTAGPSAESLTVQLGRPPITGPVIPFTYLGGKVTEWEFTQEVDSGDSGFLSLELGMDYATEDLNQPLAALVYPTAVEHFRWQDCTVTVAGAPTEVKTFSLKGENNLDTDRRFLRGQLAKKEPVSSGINSYEGSLDAEFASMAAYSEFINGTIVPLEAKWVGSQIVAGHNFELTIACPAVQFTGSTPNVSLTELPQQERPYKVLHDGVNPAVTITLKSTDTAA